jgi:hypothetical protein
MPKKLIKYLTIIPPAVILLVVACCLFQDSLSNYRPSKPSGPSRGVFNVTYDFKGQGEHPEGDSIAYQFHWGADSSDTSTWTNYYPSGTTITVSHAWRPSDTLRFLANPNSYEFEVKYRIKDQKNNRSQWSEAHIFTIVTNNQPPIRPNIPIGPSSGIVNTSYSFRAVTTDPNGDSISYRFLWGDGDTSNWSANYPSGETVTVSHTYTTPGTYFVKVQARDELGDTSSWSEGLGIIITSTAYPFTITLTWGLHPRDLDAHCWTPHPYHVYYGNKGHLNSVPYCTLDVDDVTSYGPEHITISQLIPGTYKYAVHHFSGDSTIASSQAVVKVYENGVLTYTFTPPQAPCPVYGYWHVFNIDGATQTIIPVNTYSSSPPGPSEKIFPTKKR